MSFATMDKYNNRCYCIPNQARWEAQVGAVWDSHVQDSFFLPGVKRRKRVKTDRYGLKTADSDTISSMEGCCLV